jgi:molybdopterin synthase catalytic subunit
VDIQIDITTGPIVPPQTGPDVSHGRAGAVAQFTGIVRAKENHQAIVALEYEAYQPMAQNVMCRILEEIAQVHPCLHVHVLHRLGVIPVGEAAIHVTVTAGHRAEAFAILALFMDRLKQDVPIWKSRAIRHDQPPVSPAP